MKLPSKYKINLSKTKYQVLGQTIFPKGPISEFLVNLFFTDSTNPKPPFDTSPLTGGIILGIMFLANYSVVS
jgi:hypothetical protein